MTARHRFLARLTLAAVVLAAMAAGALTAAGQSTPREKAAVSNPPAASTAALNRRYTACIKANGATWKLIPNSGGMYRVDIPPVANARCAALDLARTAAGDGDAATADWLVGIEGAPPEFWSCLGAAGFHVPGGSGQRADYGSSAFADAAGQCAATTGVTLPPR